MSEEEIIGKLKLWMECASINNGNSCIVNNAELQGLLDLYDKEKEKVKAYETECRRFKAFCKKIRKDEKHDVDLFNQGQEQKCNEFLNLIEGEQHWNYEGKYFDETDKQIEDMKQSLLGKE